jgi:hypothetical protein
VFGARKQNIHLNFLLQVLFSCTKEDYRFTSQWEKFCENHRAGLF